MLRQECGGKDSSVFAQAGQSRTSIIVDKNDSKAFAGYYATRPAYSCPFHPKSI